MKQTLFLKQLASFFDSFLPHNKNCSKNTIAAYAYGFSTFFQFMSEKYAKPHYTIDYKDLTPSVFDDYVLWMQKEKHYGASTQNQRMAAINSFLKYASRREMAAISALNATVGASTPKVKDAVFPYFTVEEMKVLLRMPKWTNKFGYRDMVILSLMYDSGARAQEICNLRYRDITLGKKSKIILYGKGSKAREVPISADVAKMIRQYLKEHQLNGNDPVFSSQRAKQMTTACIRNLVRKYVTLAREECPTLFKSKNYSPHSFRHSKAVHMLEAGVPLIYIRNFLGHESVKTTEVYARVSQAGLVKALTEHSVKSNIPTSKAEHVPDDNRPDFLKKIL